MPRIFDNIDESLAPALQETLALSKRADFCVGYFNLRGWRTIDSHVEKFAGVENQQCRLMVGMAASAEDELRSLLAVNRHKRIDQGEAIQLKKKLAESFRRQLCYGIPTDADEAGLQRLAKQLKSSTQSVAEATQALYEEDVLCIEKHDTQNGEPQLICSLGLIGN
jgi:hypothetical protein